MMPLTRFYWAHHKFLYEAHGMCPVKTGISGGAGIGRAAGRDLLPPGVPLLLRSTLGAIEPQRHR